jgi:hypothetical protein
MAVISDIFRGHNNVRLAVAVVEQAADRSAVLGRSGTSPGLRVSGQRIQTIQTTLQNTVLFVEVPTNLDQEKFHSRCYVLACRTLQQCLDTQAFQAAGVTLGTHLWVEINNSSSSSSWLPAFSSSPCSSWHPFSAKSYEILFLSLCS